MQLFFLDQNPNRAAELHVNQHVTKIFQECAQILVTSIYNAHVTSPHYEQIKIFGKFQDPPEPYISPKIWFLGLSAPIKPAYEHHPLCHWPTKNWQNYLWTVLYLRALYRENLKRDLKPANFAREVLFWALDHTQSANKILARLQIISPARHLDQDFRFPDHFPNPIFYEDWKYPNTCLHLVYQAVPDQYKITRNPVQAYRDYYENEKLNNNPNIRVVYK